MGDVDCTKTRKHGGETLYEKKWKGTLDLEFTVLHQNGGSFSTAGEIDKRRTGATNSGSASIKRIQKHVFDGTAPKSQDRSLFVINWELSKGGQPNECNGSAMTQQPGNGPANGCNEYTFLQTRNEVCEPYTLTRPGDFKITGIRNAGGADASSNKAVEKQPTCAYRTLSHLVKSGKSEGVPLISLQTL